MTVLEHLSEALFLERCAQMHSPAGNHIVAAMTTFGAAGQTAVTKTNARAQEARRNAPVSARAAASHSTAAPRKLRQFVHPAAAGEPLALPTAPQQPLPDRVAVKLARLAEPIESVKSIAQVAGGDEAPVFKRIADSPTVGNIGRPTTALAWFGIEQIRQFLADNNVSHDADATDRELASRLIAHFKESE